MGKRIFSLILMGVLFVAGAACVRAETSYGSDDWNVRFTEDKKMVSSFKSSDLDDTIYGLQPGDKAVLTVKLKNENSTATDWYMTNKVLYSLEDRSKNSATGGGAYTYKLTYKGKSGEARTLFDSDTVGGETTTAAGEGLHGATNALKDYFYLDTLAKGETGTITLEVALDGETQGNDYQDTLADLQMNFAVELNDTGNRPDGGTNDGGGSSSSTTRRRQVVRTGDETDLTPYILASTISGALLLIFAVWSRQESKKKKEGQ